MHGSFGRGGAGKEDPVLAQRGTAHLHGVTHTELPALKTSKGPRLWENPGKTPQRWDRILQVSPQAPANLPEGRMEPGVALWVQLSYLMLGRACSESLGLGRWGGSPGSIGRAPLSSPLRRMAAHKWCFRNILHMANSSLVPSSQSWASG